MTVNVEVQKTGGENTMNIIRKFTRRMQSTGIVRHMRNRRYHARSISKTVKKKQALRRIDKQATIQRLIKEGRIQERTPRTRTSR